MSSEISCSSNLHLPGITGLITGLDSIKTVHQAYFVSTLTASCSWGMAKHSVEVYALDSSDLASSLQNTCSWICKLYHKATEPSQGSRQVLRVTLAGRQVLSHFDNSTCRCSHSRNSELKTLGNNLSTLKGGHSFLKVNHLWKSSKMRECL